MRRVYYYASQLAKLHLGRSRIARVTAPRTPQPSIHPFLYNTARAARVRTPRSIRAYVAVERAEGTTASAVLSEFMRSDKDGWFRNGSRPYGRACPPGNGLGKHSVPGPVSVHHIRVYTVSNSTGFINDYSYSFISTG